MAAVDGFVEPMAASPLGVTLLAALESRARHPEGFALSLETSPPARGDGDWVRRDDDGDLYRGPPPGRGVGDTNQLVQISFFGSTLVWVGTLWIQTQRVR